MHTMSVLSTQRALPFTDSCQTDNANLILRIENGSDRNYPRWWQRMEMHAWHVHISVQIVSSLLHFINVSVSAHAVSAVQIQMIQRASFCAVSTYPNTNNQCLGWTIIGLSKKGRLLYTLYFCMLHTYLRLAYACASIILSNIQRWTRLWSWEVLHLWSTMDGARQQYDGTPQMVPHLFLMWSPFPRTSKWVMSKDLSMWYLEICIKLWFFWGTIVALQLQY